MLSQVDHKAIHRPEEIAPFRVHTKVNTDCILIRLFPAITAASLRHQMSPPVQGVVLQCYGAGNVPTNRQGQH